MKPLRVMNIHKSVCVTSFNDVLTEARGNIYADSTLISYVIWSPLSSVLWHLISDCISFYFFFCIYFFLKSYLIISSTLNRYYIDYLYPVSFSQH